MHISNLLYTHNLTARFVRFLSIILVSMLIICPPAKAFAGPVVSNQTAGGKSTESNNIYAESIIEAEDLGEEQLQTVFSKEELYALSDGKTPVSIFTVGGLGENNELRTFEAQKSFSGSAENGSEITAVLYTKTDDGDWTPLLITKTYNTFVGPSEIYRITVDLPLGETVIVLKAQKEGKESSFVITAKRKDAEIKDALKQNNIIGSQNLK